MRWFQESWRKSVIDIDKWSLWRGAGSTASISNRRLTLTPAGNTSVHLAATHPPLLTGDLVVRFRVRGSTGTHRHRVALRSDGGRATGVTGQERINTGVIAVLNNTGELQLQQVVNGTLTSLGSKTNAFTLGAFFNLRLQANAGFRVRVWADGVTEPTTWDIEAVDNAAVPEGVAHLASFKATGSDGVVDFETVSLTAPGVSLPTRSRPLIYRRPNGSLVPHGRIATKWSDPCLDTATPSWITPVGTSVPVFSTTTALMHGVRADAGLTSSLTTPAIDPALVDVIKFRIGNFHLSSDQDISWFMRFAGTTNFEIRQAATDAKMIMAIGATTSTWPYTTLRNTTPQGEGPRHRHLELWLLTKRKQLLAFEGDQLVAWMPFTAALPATLTPTISVTAPTATARAVRWSLMEVELERS